mgnify:CR=1 FL=1
MRIKATGAAGGYISQVYIGAVKAIDRLEVLNCLDCSRKNNFNIEYSINNTEQYDPFHHYTQCEAPSYESPYPDGNLVYL